jgi:acetyl-CoA acetyltransferase
MFTLEQWAQLTREALDDAGIDPRDVDGICATNIRESDSFVPSTITEYMGMQVNFAEVVDLGGASCAAMVWRAAAAIELGLCNVVVIGAPSWPSPRPPVRASGPNSWRYGASSANYGSPQAEFDIPYGNVAQNCGYAQIAMKYGAEYGYDAEALAKIAVDQRVSANHNPAAVFHHLPITVEDVLNSPMISDPIHMLEIVMPCSGGAAIVVAGKEFAQKSNHRPAWITGFGERVLHKTPTYAEDLLSTALIPAADQAFSMAGRSREEVDLISVYDCYTITVLMTIEDAGFCPRGEGQPFVREHDLSFRGDFPCNTHGGQLGFGQAGLAGGMSHITEGARQLMRRAEDHQVPDADVAFITGNGYKTQEVVEDTVRPVLIKPTFASFEEALSVRP